MKTTILTIAAVITLTLGISQASFGAAKTNEEISTVLTDVQDISEIEIHGNVELYLSDGTADQVKVYNKYYAESALVQNENGILRVTNYSAQKLKIWVTAKDLRNMYVYDNAIVKSFGTLSFIELDVKLFDRALAQLNLDTYSASVTLNNHSMADVNGSTTEAAFRYSVSSTLNASNLAANKYYRTKNIRTPFPQAFF